MNAGAAILLALAVAAPAAAQDETPALEADARSVVGLAITYQEWDEDLPWAKHAPKQRSAGAVVVDRRHLLTTADVMANAVQVRLQTYGRARQVEPRLVLVDDSINLALLELEPSPEVDDLRRVKLANQTPASGVVRTVRWRRQRLESVASRVIRFEVARAWGGRVEHAFIEMRTDLAGGGWAEPVFNDHELVGLTTSQSEQVSRAIPVEILRAFLDRATSGTEYVGFAALGAGWQVNRDPAMTAFLGQTGEPRGIIVRRVPWGSSGCGVLEPRDILLELGGYAIDAEGYYQHPRLGRLKFEHILAEEYRPGDSVQLEIMRDGREMETRMVARPYPSQLDLIPLRRSDRPPFIIAGGLVMRELDVPYLRTWGDDWSKLAPHYLLTRYYFDRAGQTPTRRRVVLLTSVLPSAYNLGYHALRDAVVEQVNGVRIGQLRDVERALRSPLDGFHVIELGRDSSATPVVLDAAAFQAATAEILETYRIPTRSWVPETRLPEGGGDCAGDY